MKIKIIKTLLSVAVLAAMTNSVWAAGTIAGTIINNTASISYSVGGTSQTAINSSPTGNNVPGAAGAPTTFLVDKKIDLNVTGNSDITIVPAASADITFTLTNEGNDKEFFSLAALDDTGVSAADDFDMTSCSTSVTAVTTPVTTPAALGTSTTIPLELVPDGTASITVTCTAPIASATIINGKISDVNLIATATATSGGATIAETGGSDDATVEETVLADAAGTEDVLRDAKHSAKRRYTVASTALSVQKTSAVSKMSINGSDVTTNVKRIPGATIDYTIIVTNTAAMADHLKISDAIPSTLTYVLNSCGIAGDGIVNTTTPDIGLAITCGIAGSTVSTTTFTLPLGTAGTPKTATLTFSATVN